jgi:alkyl hydroperoxide reductase subunit AhpC
MKKNFNGTTPIIDKPTKQGIELLLGGSNEPPIEQQQPRGVGRPKEGDSWVRASFIVDPTQLKKLRSISYHHGKTQRELVEEALGRFIAAVEAKHGIIQPIPEEANKPLLD